MDVTRRLLRQLLGGLWLLDGPLQTRPDMRTMNMFSQTMGAAGGGQPAPVAQLIAAAEGVVTPHLIAFNATVCAIQIAIGPALILDRWPRPALWASICRAFLAWPFGEGPGGMLTGTAPLATGAPG